MIETIKDSLIIFHAGVSVLLVLSVLFQPSKTDDLGSMFGGSSDSVFGADSSSFLKKLTIWLGIIFFTTSLALGFIYLKYNKKIIIEERVKTLENQQEVSEID